MGPTQTMSVVVGATGGAVGLRDQVTRVDAALRGMTSTREELEIVEAALLVEAERLQIWHAYGCASFLEYLERAMHYAPRTAHEKLRVARALPSLPTIRAAFVSKQLAYYRVRELTRRATPATEAAWLDKTRHMSARELEAYVAQHAPGDAPGQPSNPNRPVKFSLLLRPEVAERLDRITSRLCEDHGGALSDDELAEALCDAVEHPGTAEPGAEPGVEPARPPFQTAMLTCGTCGAHWQHRDGIEVPADPVLVQMACCDAEHLGDLEAETPTRIARTVTPRMRKQILARDHYQCSVPGCRARRYLHIHHIVFQRERGRHIASNLTAICSGHHRRLHEGRLVITGKAPFALRFRWVHDWEVGRERSRQPEPPRDATLEELARTVERVLADGVPT